MNPRMKSRRRALFRMGLLLTILLATPASRAETLRVGKSNDISFTFVPLDIGIQQKFFQQNGIDIETSHFGGTAKLHQALISSSIDIGLGSGTDIPYLVKGAPELGVGAIALTPAIFGVNVPYDSPVHTIADLKGKNIGISTVGSLSEWIVLQLVKKESWQRNDVTMVSIGDGANQLAAFKTGQIDALIAAAAWGLDLEQRKEARLLVPVSDFIGPFLLNVIYATNDIAEHHPDMVRGFLKAWYQSVAHMASHKTETVAVAQTVTHFSQSVQDEQYDVVMPSMSRDGTFPDDAVELVRQSFMDLKLLPAAPDMSKYLTTRFLPQR